MIEDLAESKPSIDDLFADLVTERELIRTAIARSPDRIEAPTLSPGWSVRDQVAHLAFYDRAAALSVAHPDAFAVLRDQALADTDAFEQTTLELAPAQWTPLLSYWDHNFEEFGASIAGAESGKRVPWFGPDMSLISMLSARLMETWAHGYDIVSALEVPRPVSASLRHIVVLAYRARGYGYVVRGLEKPARDTRIVLKAPSGDTWSMGAEDGDLVTGSAEEFCLVLTRRRRLDDTAIECNGDAARAWMTLGQTFSGPPGPDPEPVRVLAPQGTHP